jgi:RNA polymerase sigma-70 factor (ECF subfamily)
MQDAEMGIHIEAGQRTAIETTYRQQGDRLWRALRLSTGSSDIASDTVAEVFAQLLARGSAVRDPASWVWRSAFRIAAGELNRRGWETGPPTEAAGYEVPDETAELMTALLRLSPKQRASIVLHYQCGYSLKEVAEIIGSTPSAVGVHLHRGRKRLRELLGDEDV